MYTVHLEQDRYYAWVMMIFAGILFVAVFPFFLVTGLLAVLAVMIYRGCAYVSWRSPRECVSTLSWLAFEWDYEGIGGRQNGMRVLGMDISFSGVLR